MINKRNENCIERTEKKLLRKKNRMKFFLA